MCCFPVWQASASLPPSASSQGKPPYQPARTTLPARCPPSHLPFASSLAKHWRDTGRMPSHHHMWRMTGAQKAADDARMRVCFSPAGRPSTAYEQKALQCRGGGKGGWDAGRGNC